MAISFDKILFVGPDYKNHRGGIGAVLEIYAENIKPFNFVATMSYRNKFVELAFYTIALLKVIGKLISDRKIKLVDIHGAKDGSIIRKFFVCFIAKKLFGKKVVVHIHAGAFDERYRVSGKLYRYCCRFLINNADALVALSHRWDEFFHANFKVKKLVVINNPVEKHIDTADARKNNSFTNFLFLGRIADHKGIFDLANLVADQQVSLRGKCKFFVGGNHEVERLQQLINDKKIGDLMEYIGWTQAAEKDQYFRACDFFILPTYEEAMPMTLLEAFSYGKAAITTPVGSIPEILTDGYNGLLFQPGDMAALRLILEKVIAQPQLAETLGANALKKAAEFYPGAIKTSLEKLYAEIL